MTEYVGKHAIVIGASLAGLSAARVLLDDFEQVTVIERDRLPSAPEFRDGVPQARHIHMLLKKGEQILEELFPGLVGELTTAGCTPVNWSREIRWYHHGGFRAEFDWNFHTLTMSRSMLDWSVVRRLAALPRLRLLDGVQVAGLLVEAGNRRVTGVKLRRRGASGDADAPESVEERADLVVDASGRDSKAPSWLAELGYASPKESRVKVAVGYASQRFMRPADHRSSWKVLAIFPTSLEHRRLGMLVPIETGEWLCSVCGSNGDYPPADTAGFLEFTKKLGRPDIYEAVRHAEPTSPVHSWRRMDNQRRHYEDLSRFPDGLVVLGDAVCSFNPLYGQGITMAVAGAKTLKECLDEQRRRAPGNALSGLPRLFQVKLGKLMSPAWFMATSEDLRYPGTEGPKLPLGVKLMQAYVDRVVVAAAESPRAYRSLAQVYNMIEEPPVLFHPGVVWDVIKAGRRATA